MNKQEFLNELKQRIDMLEDSEQQDILAEYAQHIDLRMNGGLSEEEAIRDFGDLDQLAGEILGAYHVKPNFRKSSASNEPAGVSQANRFHSAYRSLCKKVKAAIGAVKNFLIRTGNGIGDWFRRVGAKVRGWFHREPTASDAVQLPPKEKKNRGAWRAALRSGWGRAMNWLGRVCILLLRLIWNVALLFCAVPVIVLALAIVLGLGALIILLFQGYPLTGVALCTLGALLCCAGLMGLGWTLVWHRPGKEDVSYEEAE